MCIRVVTHIREVALLVVTAADDVLGAGPFVRTVLDELTHGLDVGARHVLRNREVHGNELGHTQLVELQDRIRSDNRSSGEVDTLSHEVTTNATFLTLKSGTDALDGATIGVLLLRLVRLIVVHECGNQQLQVAHDVLLSPLSRRHLQQLLQFIVLSDDLLVGVRQVIVGAHAISGLN